MDRCFRVVTWTLCFPRPRSRSGAVSSSARMNQFWQHQLLQRQALAFAFLTLIEPWPESKGWLKAHSVQPTKLLMVCGTLPMEAASSLCRPQLRTSKGDFGERLAVLVNIQGLSLASKTCCRGFAHGIRQLCRCVGARGCNVHARSPLFS